LSALVSFMMGANTPTLLIPLLCKNGKYVFSK